MQEKLMLGWVMQTWDNFKYSFRYIVAPSLTIGITFILFTAMFVSVYGFVRYQWYISAYLEKQRTELSTLQTKTEDILKDLKDLTKLTTVRIQSFPQDVNRIQNILISVYRLHPNPNFPKIQKASYTKLSPPQAIVTRVGISSLNTQSFPLEKPFKKSPSLYVSQNKDTLFSQCLVFNTKKGLKAGLKADFKENLEENLEEKDLEGILEIQISMADLKSSLGNYETLSLSPLPLFAKDKISLLQTKPFAIYGIPFLDFWQFIVADKLHYGVFIGFMLIAILFVNFQIYFYYRRLRKIYGKKIENLKTQVLTLKAKAESLKTSLGDAQKSLDHLQTGFEAYKTFHNQLMDKTSEQMSYIVRSLEIVRETLMTSFSPLPENEPIKILQSCLHTAQLLSQGLVVPTKHEPISLRPLLEDVLSLFTERVGKFEINLYIKCPEGLFYYGDFLFIKLILTTVIGKPIYRVPKNGKVSIIVSNQLESLQFDVQDNGYHLGNMREEFSKKSFDLFVEEDALSQVCQTHNIMYECSKTSKGFNQTKIIFLNSTKNISNNNVIPLFQ